MRTIQVVSDAARAWTSVLVAVALLVMLSACSDKPVAPPESLPPPPEAPTPEEIAAEVRAGLTEVDAIASWQAPITEETRNKLIAYLRDAKRKHANTEWGRKGLGLVAHGLENQLMTARDDMHSDLVMFLCDLVEALEPDNTKLARYREWAKIQLHRPIVDIVGWWEFEEPKVGEEEIYVLLKIYFPETGKVERARVQEGEEFLGMRFRKIIGKKRGIILEYISTGDRFAIYGPGPRARTIRDTSRD